MDMEKIKTFFR